MFLESNSKSLISKGNVIAKTNKNVIIIGSQFNSDKNNNWSKIEEVHVQQNAITNILTKGRDRNENSMLFRFLYNRTKNKNGIE